MLLRRFDSTTAERLLAAAGTGSGTPLVGVGIRQLGGALADEHCGRGGVAGPIAEPYLAFAIGIPGLGGNSPEQLTRAHHELRAALGDAATERTSYNFLGQSGMEAAFDTETLTRLRELKRRRAPESRLRMTRPLLAD